MKRVGGASGRFGKGLLSLEEVWEGSGSLGEVWEGSRNPRGRLVGVERASERTGRGRWSLREDEEGSRDPRGGPG